MTITAYTAKISQKAIDVVEPGDAPRRGRIAFDLGRDLEFSTEALRSYAFALREPVIYDAMVVAAAIEFSDQITKRPSRGWARQHRSSHSRTRPEPVERPRRRKFASRCAGLPDRRFLAG